MCPRQYLVFVFILVVFVTAGCTDTETRTKPSETEVKKTPIARATPTKTTVPITTPTKSDVKYAKYTNDLFDFAIEYPVNWEYREGGIYLGDDINLQTTSIVIFYKTSIVSDEYEAVGILYNKIDPETALLLGIDNIESLVRYTLTSAPSAKIKSISSEIIGGKEYGVAEFVLATGGQILLKKVYILWDSNTGDTWIISAETNKKNGFEDEEIIKHFPESFNILSKNVQSTPNPMQTKTSIPTATPILTPTPSPSTSTPPQENQKGTLKNPAKIGETLMIEDLFEKWEITVLSYERGESTTNKVLRANMFNEKPNIGYEYLLVRISVKYVEGQESAYVKSFVAYVDGEGFDPEFIMWPENMKELDLMKKLLPGGKTEGWLAFIVPKGKKVLLAYESLFEPLGFIEIPAR